MPRARPALLPTSPRCSAPELHRRAERRSPQTVEAWRVWAQLAWCAKAERPTVDVNEKVHEYELDTKPPRAARAHALTFTALLDAYIACWDAKYHYLVGRPIHFDPTIDTSWTTYPLDSYPSGYSSNLTAPATVLGYLFPRDAQYFLSRAKENAASRMWSGIHFRSDSVAGVELGRQVGQAVIAYAKAYGSS